MTTTTRVQIVGRIPRDLSRRVRAVATRRKVRLNACVIEALTVAVRLPRPEGTGEPSRSPRVAHS
jgi:hypothetical protein